MIEQITSAEWVALVITICLGFVGIGAALWKVAKPHVANIIKQAIEPLDKRVTVIEEGHEELNNKKILDHGRMGNLERQMKIVLKSQLALLSYSKTGDDSGGLDKAMKELQEGIIGI